MSAKLIVSVTLLSMLVHSILGCCWHHAHSEFRLGCAHSTSESYRGHHHQHDHRSEHKDPVVPAPLEHDQSCDDAPCVYVVAEPIRNEFAPGLHERVATLDYRCSLVLNAAVTATSGALQRSDAPLPSQHCALTQVWVV